MRRVGYEVAPGSTLDWSFVQNQDTREEWLTHRHASRVGRLEDQIALGDALREEALDIQQTEPNRSNRLMRRALRMEGRRANKKRRIARLDRVYTRRLNRTVSAFDRQCWNGT